MDQELRLSLIPPVRTWRERFAHWLQDDGLYSICNRTVMYSACCIVSLSLGGLSAYGYTKAAHKHAPPVKQFSRIIDRHKEAGPSTMGRIHFDLQPKPERIFR